MFIEKQNPEKIIRELTYNIGNVSADLNARNKNRQDIDIMAFTYDDAKYIRRQMQLEDEDFYYLYIYVNTFADNIKELEDNINKIQSILGYNGIKSRKGYFREEQIYFSTMPFFINQKEIKNAIEFFDKCKEILDVYVANKLYVSTPFQINQLLTEEADENDNEDDLLAFVNSL